MNKLLEGIKDVISVSNNIVTLRFMYEWHDDGYHTDRGYYSYGTEGEPLSEISDDEEILTNLGMKVEEYTEESPYGCGCGEDCNHTPPEILIREYSKGFESFTEALKFAWYLNGVLDCLKAIETKKEVI